MTHQGMVARFGVVATAGIMLAALAGCGTEPASSRTAATPDTPSIVAEPQLNKTIPAQTASRTVAKTDAKLTQSFSDATRSEPPADGARPPDVTMTGKSVGKLFLEVEQSWDRIHLVGANGQPITYTARLDTQLGQIDIALHSDQAPNHVRNFIALARSGYYDGLVFQRTVRERSEGQPDLELIEAGCPTGTGEVGVGNLGYWLRPEFNDAAHEEGTVGMCHGAEPDSACCKFYVTLGKAPYLDKNFTVFGKVTSGLDVARRIFSLPVRNDAEYPEGDRPENPVVIRKVTIQAREAESSDSGAVAK